MIGNMIKQADTWVNELIIGGYLMGEFIGHMYFNLVH